MTSALSSVLRRGLDWLLPPLCPATGVEVGAHGTVAPEYWASLRFIRAPFCACCALPFPYDAGGGDASRLICGACLDHPPRFRQARAPLVYDDASRRVIMRYKHGDQIQALSVFVPWLQQAGAELIAGADVIVPVPLHRWRLLKRRYNQSALLARALGRAAGKRSCVDGLLRIRPTKPQGKMPNREDRARNVKGVFKVNPARLDMVAGKTVLLIDDVLTTGATLNACADALYAAGAAAVDVLTIARVPRD